MKHMKIAKQYVFWSLLACSAALWAGSVAATELVYVPVNPAFGGNPNNAPGLLAAAQAQNGFKAPVNSTLQNFNINLQNAILGRLSNGALSAMFGKSNTIVPGTYDTLDYTISVTDTGGGNLNIVTTDKHTHASATFTVSSGLLTQ